MRASLDRTIAQAAQAISRCVKYFRFFARIVRMQQPALFDREHEDQPIDETQELVEIALRRQRPAAKIAAQRMILRMGKEALTQGKQSILDASSQMLAC